MKVFEFYNSDGAYVGEWGDEISVMDVYNEESGQAEFIVVPAEDCTGSIIFTKSDFSLTVPIFKSYYDIAYGQKELQKMDIHVPEGLTDDVPVVITIHGGNWIEGSKGHYTYMTDFITDTCNCVHVNMNYRLTTSEENGNGVTIAEMMEDIGLVIGYLQTNDSEYHINPSQIALMGWSAGGHLALLYAYDTAGNYSRAEDNPIKLVISEAGPTDLVAVYPNANSAYKNTWRNMLGNPTLTTDGALREAVKELSPYYILYNEDKKSLNIDADLIPYTILMYGNGYVMPSVEVENSVELGDEAVYYSQGITLRDLLPTTKCSFFTFNVSEKENLIYNHTAFKDDQDNDYKDTIFPGSTDFNIHAYYYGKNEDNEEIPGLKKLINSHLLGNTNN